MEMGKFTCESCGRQFTRRDNRRHEQGYCKSICQLCEVCGMAFSSSHHFRKHQIEKHGLRKRKFEGGVVLVNEHCLQKKQKLDDVASNSAWQHAVVGITDGGCVKCGICEIDIPRKYMSQHCRSLNHKNKMCVVKGNGIKVLKQSFKNHIATYRIGTDDDKVYVNVKEYMKILKQQSLDLVLTTLHKNTAIKINMELFGVFVLESKGLREVKSFNSKFKICDGSADLVDMYESFVDEIDNKISEFQEGESGWALEKLQFLEVNINKYNPLKASSYIPLPSSIQRKNGVVNVQNFDSKCFMWSILAALHPVDKDPQRVSKYAMYENDLNFDGIEFPVKLKDINKFEGLNDISVNVYGLNSVYKGGEMSFEVVGPLHFTKTRRDTHINLLLVDNDDGLRHYCLIKNLSRLVRSQLSKKKCQKFLCDGCLVNFMSRERLTIHQENDCGRVRVVLPTTEPRVDKFGNTVPQNILKFEAFEKQLKHPFSIYGDFEAIPVPIEHCQQNDSISYTEKTKMHVPYSFAYYIKCSYDDSLSKLELYRGSDCVEVFCQRLEADIRRIYNEHLIHVMPMNKLTEIEELGHEIAVNCHICEKSFKENEDRVRDHCHLTGYYRGPAHVTCNLNYKFPNHIPVFFHNLSNYDAHLFVKALGSDEGRIDVVAENKEKYISFTKNLVVDTIKDSKGVFSNKYIRIRFLDSFRFMPMGLAKLAENLSDEQCVEIKKSFSEEKKFNLIRQKGVFPYSYINDFSKLDDVVLPSREQFYNDLTNTDISEAEHRRAQKVWQVFGCKTLGEYSDIYLKSDVLLLADVFQNFRNVCMEAYKLDPCHFFTAPGLSWDTMLKYTGIELELLSDIDMLHFFKRGIRGGLCQCSKRVVEANNPYMSTFNPDKQTSFLSYLDATNLYGASLSMSLPTGNFHWLSKKQIEDFNILEITDISDKGYVLEVDLDYPKSLHDHHNDLPFAPENMVPPNSKHPKLIANLNSKEKYVIHYRNLKQLLNAGLKLRKINRILSFDQSQWLKKYVDLNTEKRNRAINEFEKTFYKLMNNSVFGKTMENVEKRSDIKLVTHWKNLGRRVGAEALIGKPNFKESIIFSENLVAIQMEKLHVRYDKPIYIGFCVLDLAKLIMYDFYYNFIKLKYGINATLAYTDTDSLVLEVFAPNFYEDIKNNIEVFDTSNYSVDNQFGIPKTISIIGKMKDEYGGKVIWEFVGTGAKAYIVNVEGEFTKKAKGIQSSVVKNELTMTDYKDVVLRDKTVYKKVKTFRSHKHQVYTELKNKVALSPEDDKRYIIPDGGGNTLAWGHYKIAQLLNT